MGRLRFITYLLRNKEIKIVEYAHMTQQKIKNYIRSIKRIPQADYIFLADADGASVDQKRNKVKTHYPECDIEKIYIVQREIESWYLAGVNSDIYPLIKEKITNTDDVSKEKFLSMIPKNYTKILFMSEILQRYNLSLACSRNTSLAYFAKCLL